MPASSAVSEASLPPLLADPTHGLAAATAARPAVASPRRTTGPKVRRCRDRSAAIATRREQDVVVEAGVRAGVAGRAGLVDGEQHRVAVAVEPDLDDALGVAGGLALDPVLLARAAPVGPPPGRQGAVQRLVVHPAQHQHLTGAVLLHDGGDEPVGVALEPAGDGGIQAGVGGAHVSSIREVQPHAGSPRAGILVARRRTRPTGRVLGRGVRGTAGRPRRRAGGRRRRARPREYDGPRGRRATHAGRPARGRRPAPRRRSRRSRAGGRS